MQRRLFLHIGDCKTGSTTVQTMLANGDGTAKDARLIYPTRNSHAMLARSWGESDEIYHKRWSRVANRLARAQWDMAVLSSELFEFIAPHKVAKALAEHLPDYADTVQVIAYVRPHAGRVLSQFAENLKLGHDTDGFDEFLDRLERLGRLDYSARLGQWKDAFGDRLQVRPFIRERLVHGDIRHDFLTQVIGPDAYTLNETAPENQSLPLSDLTLMRLMQRYFIAKMGDKHPNHIQFGKHFADVLRAAPSRLPPQSLRLPRAAYGRIVDMCMADAEAMDATWFGGPCLADALRDTEKDVIDTAQSLDADQYHSPETIRLMQCWGDLLMRQMSDPPAEFSRRLRDAG